VNISEPFIRRPVATALLMAAVAFAGLVAFPFLPVAPLPQVDFPTIQVTAGLPGASPETMAGAVASPLERQFGQIPGVTQMTSLSTLGATTIVVQFEINRNSDGAAQDIQAAITAAGKQLPTNLYPPPNYKKVNPADFPIMILALTSDVLPLTRVDDYADNILAQQISQVPGVAQVGIGGEQKPSIRVQIDPGKLSATGLTLEDVRAILATTTTTAAKGTLNGAAKMFTIAANDQMMQPGQYDDVILAYRNGAPIRVRDVGQSVEGPADITVAAYNALQRCVMLVVYRQPGANIIETVDTIRARLPALRAIIPPSIKIDVILDRTVTIRAAVADVELTLALTVVLVVLVILVFIRNFWVTLIPAVTLPLALFGSFAAMHLFGFSLDNLSLMALTIAVGFVVDDAIVVVENIYRHLEDGDTPLDAALNGAREVGFTVVSISVSLIAAFIPLLLMGGFIGRVFREFALTVTASIVVSAIVSLTLAPMMASRFMRRPAHRHGRLYLWFERGFERIVAGYRRTLDVALRHQPLTLAVFFATVALTAFMVINIPKGFFPNQDTGTIFGLIEAAQDASPAEMMKLNQAVSAIIARDPDIEAFGSNLGNASTANTSNTGRFYMTLKPRGERGANAYEIIARLRTHFAALKGVAVFMQVPQDITVGGRLARGQYQYTLQDPDIGELAEWSSKMLAKMKTMPAVLADVSSDLLSNAPQLTIGINRDQASRFGISPQLIDDTLNDAFGQRQVVQYFTQVNTYWVILEVAPSLLGLPSTLERIFLKSPLTGAAVPLSSLVTIDDTKVGPLAVNHQSQFPAVTLAFNLPPNVALGQAVDAVENAALELKKPASVIATFQGNAQAFQSSLASEPALIAAALVVVYIILGMLYESFIHPLTILSTLPSAGVGALLALNLGGYDLSVIGIIGIILLIGIVKKNGIMLVDFAIVAERDRGLAPLDAIREACLLRFRPIMMTTAAAMLAGLPLMLGTGTGSEFRQPLGYTMVGGLALSQLLTLYTTPVVYLYLDRLQSWLSGRNPALVQEATPSIAAEAAE
jgi:hydrophobe/amphiphile efflux-1 (HAE1) family protein